MVSVFTLNLNFRKPFFKILRILYFKECSYGQLDNIAEYVVKNIIVSIILLMMLNL